MPKEKEYCFATLALGPRYRAMTVDLAAELAQHAPGASLVVYSDRPSDFDTVSNIKAFPHRQYGILHCYNDKLFLIETALSIAPVVIHIDADTHIVDRIPEDLHWKPGITSVYENLVDHVTKNRPHSLPDLKKVADKLEMTPNQWENAVWIGEALYVVVPEGGKEREFLRMWQKIGDYMELRGMYAGSGNFMGLAAAKVGLSVHNEGYRELAAVLKHWDASLSRPKPTLWKSFSKRFGYHYRLNRARLRALQDFDFYYR